MTPVIVIRPQPGCDATVAAAQQRGLDAHGFPLFRVAATIWQAPAPDSFDALLIGSANALRLGGAALASYAGKPAYVVGMATARIARDAGLNVVCTGSGGLQAALANVQPGHARLLRLSGRERLELATPLGCTIAERIVYASNPQAMPTPLRELLSRAGERQALVLLHSAEAARHFAQQCAVHHLARNKIVLAAMGPRIADAAGAGWARIATAPKPDDGVLLALVDEMCQTGDGLKQG